MPHKQPDILLDITMTACRRPEILKQTLNSFFRNMLEPIRDKCRLIINLDPIGDDIDSESILPIITAYFKYYHIHFPMNPSFPHAFKWVWDQSEAPWVFHLEDDWELLQPVDIMAMIQTMQDYPQLALLRLPHKKSEGNTTKQWNLFFPHNGRYFVCPPDRIRTAGFAGHPSLIRDKFIHSTRPFLSTEMNPEKQFHGDNYYIVNEVMNWEYGVWGNPGDLKYIQDIGEQWRVANKFLKGGAANKAFFKVWEKYS